MSFDSVVTSLRAVAWSSAPDWDDRAAAWLWSYYRRIDPIWPADRARIPPADRVLVDAVMGARTEAERARIAEGVSAVRAAADEREDELESTTRDLLPLILAWAIAVEVGELTSETDPGAPLVALFEAGFQIQHRHEGIHLHYRSGWRIYQPPTRESLAA